MVKVKLYSWDYCPFCIRAKNLLKSKNIEFEEINLDGKDEELAALISKTGMKTVPQIFFGNEFIGGFSELAALNNQGELESILARNQE